MNRCKGFEYVGIGYDSIITKLTTEDDPITDAGYRWPIIDLRYVTPSSHIGCVYPIDTYYRPFLSCKRKESISQINSASGYENAFGIEAKTNFKIKSVEFAANAQYEQSSKNLKNNKYREIVNIVNCFQAEMGIPINLKWNMKLEFKRVVLGLKEAFGINTDQMCTYNNYNKGGRHCREIKRWMNLIESYGTHYIHKIRIGGKLVQSLKLSELNIKDMEKRNINVEAAVQAEMLNAVGSIGDGPDKVISEVDKNAIKKIRVIGGIMPELPLNERSFREWTRSLDSDSMPIYVEIDPLFKLIEHCLINSENKFNIKNQYNMALDFYAELKGATYKKVMEISGYVPSISRLIRNSDVVVLSTHDRGVLRCKEGSRILAGLSILFGDDGRAIYLSKCESGSTECNVEYIGNVAYTWAWALCSGNILPNIEQLIVDFKGGSLKCPEGYKKGFGLAINDKVAYYVNDYISDLNEGELEGMGGWLVCFDDGMIYDNYSIIVKAENYNKKVVSTCQDSIVIGGIRISKSSSIDDKLAKLESCDKFIKTCEAGPKAGLVWIICGV